MIRGLKGVDKAFGRIRQNLTGKLSNAIHPSSRRSYMTEAIQTSWHPFTQQKGCNQRSAYLILQKEMRRIAWKITSCFLLQFSENYSGFNSRSFALFLMDLLINKNHCSWGKSPSNTVTTTCACAKVDVGLVVWCSAAQRKIKRSAHLGETGHLQLKVVTRLYHNQKELWTIDDKYRDGKAQLKSVQKARWKVGAMVIDYKYETIFLSQLC